MSDDNELWDRLVQSYIKRDQPWAAAAESFLKDATVPIETIRRGIIARGYGSFAGLDLVPLLNPADRTELFREIFDKCLTTLWGQFAQEILMSLPREWLLQNLETACLDQLAGSDDQDFRLLMGVLWEFDIPMAIRIATSALQSNDCEIREVAQLYLDKPTP